jgi:NADPH2:quinone reductase
MKSLRFSKFGDLTNLTIEELPLPTLAANEILVKIRAASINPSDVKNVQGKMEGVTLPRTPGRDFAGVVVEGPPNIKGMEVWGTGGDVGFTRDGSHAEFIVVPADAAVAKPPNLSFEEAACAGLNFVTAYEGLVSRALIKPGETLLVTGAEGGVGSAAMQLGQAVGAKLISVDRKPLDPAAPIKFDLLGHIDTSRVDVTAATKKITAGKGVDVAYDCVGGAPFAPVLSTLTQLGRQIVITSVGTRQVTFDLLDFYHRRLTLLGVDSRALTVTDCARLLQLMSPFFAAGRLKPSKISHRGSLADAQVLYSAVDKGAEGKAVFVFD